MINILSSMNLANRYLNNAHSTGIIFCITVIALIILVEFILLWDQSHTHSRISGTAKIVFVLCCIIGYGFFSFNENTNTAKYKNIIHTKYVVTNKRLKHTPKSNHNYQKIKNKKNKYAQWLES